jgi:hypothetical protein
MLKTYKNITHTLKLYLLDNQSNYYFKNYIKFSKDIKQMLCLDKLALKFYFRKAKYNYYRSKIDSHLVRMMRE